MKFLKLYILLSFFSIHQISFAQTSISIGISNGNNTICAGATVTFFSQVNNCNSPTYQWYLNNNPITGATNFTYTNSTLVNGDLIYCKQTNISNPCTAASSNAIIMTVNTQPSLTLISAGTTTNQTVCINNPIVNIQYSLTGNYNSISISGLPIGVTGSLSAGVYTISGSPSQLGNFNYTLTASSTFCGSSTRTGSIAIIDKVVPTLIAPSSSTTSLTTFNGIEYLIRCTSTPPSNITIANGISASNQANVTSYKIVWGDGTADTIFNSFTTNIVHQYAAGFYQLVITVTSTSGCEASKTYGIFVGNSPSGSIVNPGNLSGCVPKTIDFPIASTAGNIPGTIYKIYWGDGDSATYIHPNIPSNISHTYLRTTCGSNLSSLNPNSFTATMIVTNPCYPAAQSSINNIQINEPPIANFNLIPNKICKDKVVNIVNSSTNGNVVSTTGCKSSIVKYWTISPSSGWNTTSNLGNNGGNPNDIDLWTNADSSLFVTFTQPGKYYITLNVGNGCSGISSKLDSLIVNPIPNPPTVVSPVVYCQNSLADSLVAYADPNNSLKWYLALNGGVGSFVSPTPSTSSVGSTNFYVSQISPFNCESTRVPITVNINPTPVAPTVNTPIEYCHNATATALSASSASGNTIKWYTVVTGGTSSSSAPTPSTNTVGTISYYVSQTNSFNCESPRAEIKVNINPNPSSPNVVSPITYCQFDVANALTATASSGNNLLWYNTSSGGIGNSTAPTPSTSTVGSIKYYVSQISSKNCEGSRDSITVIINPKPSKPSVVTPVKYCQGATTIPLTASGNGSNTILWYTSSSGGTGNSTAPTPSSASVGSTFFYVSQLNSFNCESLRDSIEVIINITPTSPIVSSPIILCQNQVSSPLTASASSGNSLLWYNVSSGGVGNSTAPTPSTATIGTTNFYVSQVTSQNCESPRALIQVTVNPVPNISNTTFTNPTLCANADGSIALYGLNAAVNYNVNYTLNGTAQSANITANSSGVVTITNLVAGNYTNIYVVLNGCNSNIKGPIALTDPNPPNTPVITAVDSICSGNNLSLAATTTTSGTAIYNWTGPNGFTSSQQNPSINNIITAYSGTYSVTVKINNCVSAAGTKIIRVDSTPQQPTIITNSPVCIDSTLFLSASTASVGTMSYQWNGPNSFSSAIQNPSINNVTNINAGVYTVTVKSNANCISAPRNATVVVNPTPVINPRNDTTYKDGDYSGVIKFTANLPGTQFSWTNSNTNIGLANNGADSISFNCTNSTVNPISGLITVTPIKNGCPGLPKTFTITVNPTPKLSSPLKDSICTGNLFNYQATSATSNVKFTWVRNVVSGISNGASSSTDSTGSISEILINTTTAPIKVVYKFSLHYFGNISTQNVLLTVYPKAKANFSFTINTFCAPANLDSSKIKLIKYDSANVSYKWYANNILIGTNSFFPSYTINNPNDSVVIKLISLSKYGCTNDSISYKFYTFLKPNVSFTKSIGQGCGPLSVSFNNASIPLNYSNYHWDFGNGITTNNIQPPTIVFQPDTNTTVKRKDTTYYIKLYAYTNCDTLIYLDSVRVFPQPKSLFQPNSTIGCSIFAFSAVNNSWGTNNTYIWNFGDNTILYDSTGGIVNHNYYSNVIDTFTVKLVTNNACGTDTFAVDIVVYPNTIVPSLIIDGISNYACAPINIKFVNNSSGANKFTLNFGDGSLPNISFKYPDTIYHQYNSGGNYIVTFKAQNNCTDSTITLNLQLYDKPTASFTLASNQFCKKQPILFNNTSNSTLSYQWLFGNGATSTQYKPIYTYTTAGTYTITLIVKNINPSGAICTDTTRKTITINDLPNMAFTDNAALQNCQPFFYNATTNQPANFITNWTFYDPTSIDTIQFGNNGTHIFYNPGNFIVRLVVITNKGCSDTTSTTVKVIETPKANFKMSDSTSCVPGKLVNFTNLYTYTAADAVNSQWFVNGNLIATTKNFSYLFTTSLNITNAVVFNIKLVVTNSFGCKDSITKSFTVLPSAKPSFTITPLNICTPTSLQLTNTSLYANIYKWYLDGQLFSNQTTPNPIVLSQPNTLYTIKLVADHTQGCGADSIVQQYSTAYQPQAIFSIPIKTSCTGILNIQCNNASFVTGGNIVKSFWDFGDGDTSTIKNPTHTYTQPGRYTVTLYVQDNKGCYSPITSQTVTNFGKPKSNFTVSNACLYNPVIPVNLSTPGFGSTNITSYLWNFGDGTLLIGQQPIHIYVNEGDYTIKLITTSDSSCVADTFSYTISIFGKPTANFSWQNNCVLLNTFFSNTSLPGFKQSNITNSKWSFGDGGFGNNLNATHIYNAIGNYTVQLIVSSNQCPNLKDSIKKVVPIYQGRQAIVYPRLDGVRGIPLQLNAQPGGISYQWSPSLGLNSDIIQSPIATYAINAPNIIDYNIDIKDSVGCVVTDKQTVWLFSGSDVYIPTAFSPNGDGANDILKPLYVGISRIQFLRIFDRWGKLVFETSDMNKAWDGNLNGSPLPIDTYAWIVSGFGENGKEVLRKGNVTLIRN